MTTAAKAGEGLETPSGKGAGDENFPVGSRLIARRLRPHVAVFYAFARAIDDIADNPDLPADDKVTRLENFAAAIRGETRAEGLEKAVRMRASLQTTGVEKRHCLDLISAFQQDAVKGRYADWGELMDYCDRSAAPVGRYLLDLHGEPRAAWPANDALCNSLQVLNHLQDCAEDYARLDRVYLPQAWMREEGTEVAALAGPRAEAGLRRVLDRCLAGCRDLNARARELPAALASRRLAAESAVILEIARRLSERLAREDPIATRVELTKAQTARAAASGLVKTLLGRR